MGAEDDTWGNIADERRRTLLTSGVVFATVAVLMAIGMATGRIADVSGAGLGVVAFAVAAVVVFRRATRFRIVRDATVEGATLTLSTSDVEVVFGPADVSRTERLASDPYQAIAPRLRWNEWIRIDASAAGARGRHYLVWKPDAPAFIEELRRAGFPTSGDASL